MEKNIKRIAEGLGIYCVGFGGQECANFGGRLYDLRKFNPYESWADCGLVLEALVKKQKIQIIPWFEGDNNDFVDFTIENDAAELGEAEDLKELVCTAYLSLIGE